MRTNGFAIFRGPGARAKAEGAVARVDRHRLKVLTGPVGDLGTEGRAAEDGARFVAYSLEEKETLPLIHGFAEDPDGLLEGHALGEFAFVAEAGGRMIAGRDSMGTRPLYADEGRTCVASDHRFFARSPVLLSRGARLDIGSGEESISLRPVPASADLGIEEAADRLSRLLEESVARRVKGRTKVAVSFSGGLDSSLIALLASRHTEVVLCSAYTTGSRDEGTTLRAAGELGLEHEGAVVGSADAAREVRTLDLPFEAGPMDRALWCLYSTTSRMAAENGAGLILLGQLADELFGGYMKYSLQAKENEASAVQMMERDVAGAADRAFVRDELACARFVEARFPFADQGVAGFARSLPLSHKIRGGERKAVLRMAATKLGLPDELVRAPKKAAQYSTGLSKLFS
jgi:asparagine synthase (glutamine-hydrolysing)